MTAEVIAGLLIPLAGTTLGAACVFLLRQQLPRAVERALAGFAGGVMIAASVWSLIIPSIEASEAMGQLAFLPAFVGFWAGTLFILLLDHVIPHLHLRTIQAEGPHTNFTRKTLLVLAVTLHNIPEGMAVGVVFAGWMTGSTAISLAGAMTLAIGIALQNFPEGAIISLPLYAEGASRKRAFLLGFGSGAVEPVAALITIAASSVIVTALPCLLGFAAGAMVYVVVEELIPEMSQGEHSNVGAILFAAGFTIMMALDVALG